MFNALRSVVYYFGFCNVQAKTILVFGVRKQFQSISPYIFIFVLCVNIVYEKKVVIVMDKNKSSQ